jgi:hypothetical protein
MTASRGIPSHHRTERTLALVAAVLLAVACKKDAPPDGAANQPAAVGPGTATAPPAPGRGGLDRCLVGRWKGTRVSFQNGRVAASGGANVGLEVKPTGESSLDFDKMDPIHATAAPTTFDFTYSGKSTAKLMTPNPGSLSASTPDYSKVRVTAKVSVPAAGSVELFKDTPVSELEKLAESVAEPDDDLPLPAPAAPPPKTIDSSPVFSSTRYTCTGNKLQLQGATAGVVWDFERSP